MSRVLIVLGLALMTANCASRDNARTEAVATYAFASDAVLARPIEAAFVRLPPVAGRISAVRERRYVNGVMQQIALADGDSSNRVEIAVGAENDRSVPGAEVPMSKPTEEGIRFELAERFPGVPMQVVTRSMSNAYGTFGLAIGRASGDVRCIYGWQWIDDVRDLRSSKASVFKKLNAAVTGEISHGSLRLRVCRHGLTVDQLAGAMAQLVIAGPVIDQTMGPSTVMSGPASQGSLESQISPPPAYQVPLQPRPAPPARRRVAAPKPNPVEPEKTSAPPLAVQEDGRRYLAPVNPNASPSRGPEASSPRYVPPPSNTIGRGPRDDGARENDARYPKSGLPPAYLGGSSAMPPLDPNMPSRAYTGPSRAPAGEPSR